MTTTISATASVRVRGAMNTPEAAASVAQVLGAAIGSALTAATIAPTAKPKSRSSSFRDHGTKNGAAASVVGSEA